METSHIENTIKYLQKHKDFYDDCFGDNWFGYEYINNSHLVKKKIKELQDELDRRGKEKAMEEKYIELIKKHKNIFESEAWFKVVVLILLLGNDHNIEQIDKLFTQLENNEIEKDNVSNILEALRDKEA